MIIWKVIERPILYKPVLIEGLPGIGNVGKVTVEYLIEKLNAKKFAELYSDAFPYHVFVTEKNTVELPKNEFYYAKHAKGDLILLTGDFQSMTAEGHYELASAILDFVKEFGVREIITVGGFGIETIPKEPKVIGAVTHEELIEEFEKLGVSFERGERVGMIIGAAGLLLGLGKLKGMRGISLLGETLARPLFTDVRAAKKILEVLDKYFELDLDMRDIEEKAKELEKAIAKAKELERKMLEALQKKGGEELSYIG